MAEGPAAGDIRPVVMPKWGLAMTEGTVVAWHAAEGAEIRAGGDLVDIETTKITNVLESPAAGLLRRHVVPEGASAPVGALLAVLAGPEVSDAAIDAYVAEFAERFAAEAAERADGGPAEPETVEAGGVPISYVRMGDGDGAPLVLVHGFGGDLNNWLFNQPALAARHAVYALDLPGHGRSGKDVGTGEVAWFAAILAAALEAVGIARAHLVGHSLGGAIALQLALDRPDRAASLTLIAPAGLGPEINMDYVEGFIRAGRRKEMKAVLALLFADPGLISRDMVEDVLRYKRLDGVERALAAVARAAFPGGRQDAVLRPRLAALTVPAQVVWGREDRIVPADHAARLPANVAVHVLESAGHMVHMEKPAEVNALIEALAAR
ncbi:MAG: acetoin dehydrogenase dihydrolipoyllysine-residue acetyltransferase subunit [Kiloniellaceae bacterium]